MTREDAITNLGLIYKAFIRPISEEQQELVKETFKMADKALEQEIGHWSRKTKVDAYDLAGVKTWGIKCQCDRCTFTTIVVEYFGYYTYCPNCGAKMESEEK